MCRQYQKQRVSLESPAVFFVQGGMGNAEEEARVRVRLRSGDRHH